MLFCCLSCDRSFLRPLASLRTDRLFLDTASAAAVESLTPILNEDFHQNNESGKPPIPVDK